MNPRAACLALMLLPLATCPALADPIVSWPSLSQERGGHWGLFTAWAVEQRKVEAALRDIEHADPDRDISDLRRRVAEDPANLETVELLAVRYWHKGMYPEAAAEFRRVLDLNPASTRCRLSLAEVFRELGSVGLAVRELAEGIQREPQSVALRQRLAELHTARGSHRRAVELWQDVLRLRPKDLQAHVELGRALLRDGQQEAARGAMDAALRLAGADAAALLAVADLYRVAGNLRAATEIWLKLSKGKATHRRALIGLALARLHAGEYAEALAAFQETAAEPGGDGVARAGAAAAALGLGDQEAVVNWCRRLREGGYGRLGAVLLANLWLVRGDAAAIEAVWAARGQESQDIKGAYQQFIGLVGTNAGARRDLGLFLSRAEVLRRAGWREQGIEALQAARKIAPASVMLAEALAAGCAAVGRADQELAIREEMAQTHPDDPLVCQGVVRALLQRGQRAKAEEVNGSFLKRFFADLESRVAAAEIAIGKGDYQAAVADCQSVLARHPNDDRPYNLLVDAMVRSGEFAAAVSAIRSREGALPRFLVGPLERAILAMADGKPDDAISHARRGTRRTPLDHRLWLIGALALEAKGDASNALAYYRAAGWLCPHQFSAQLTVARAATRCENIPVADEAYRAALALAPEARDVQLEFADALTHWGKHDAAIALLASLAPGTTVARDAVSARLAEAHLARGDAARALELVRDTLARDPADPVARRVALAACRKLGDVATAIKVCELAISRNPEARVELELGLLYLLERRYKEADERLGAGIERAEGGAQRFELRRLQAAACIALDLPQRALRALDDAVRSAGPKAVLGDDLALELAAAGADAEARNLVALVENARPTRGGWLRTAVARLPADRQLAALVLTGYAASAAGWRARAAELFAAAVLRAPDEPLLLYQAAQADAEAGRTADALAIAQKLAAQCPKAGDAQLLLASVLEKAGKLDAALVAYRQALPLLDKEAAADRLAVAERFRAAGKVEDAIEAYRSVLAAEPVNLPASIQLARLYANHMPERLADAEQLASVAVKVRPKDAECHDTLGWILFLLKKGDAARGEIAAAIALDPRNAAYYYHLGMADYVGGRRGLARRALRLAISLDPKLPGAESARSTLKAIEAEVPPAELRPAER